MQVSSTALPEVLVITPKCIGDARGFFSEVYSREAFAEAGIDVDFPQDNHSLSTEINVVRGLHYQLPPFAQAKLIRVVRGAILDVAVDLRRNSSTFGRHVAVELSAKNWKQMFVPAGYAHGFRTLEPNTEVFYKVSCGYSPAHERGIRWDDPAMKIDWGIGADQAAILSPRDREHPALADAVDLY